MFDSIKINNFKAFSELKIKNLKQFNLFVGRNESGKTSILEAIFLLINPNNPKLPVKINFFRELTNINSKFFKVLFNKEKVNRNIVLEAKLVNPNEERKLSISCIEKVGEVLPKEINKQNENIAFQFIKEGEAERISEILNIKMLYEHTSNDGIRRKYYPEIIRNNGNYSFLGDKNYKEKLNGVFVQDIGILPNIVPKLDEIIMKKKKKEIIKVLKRIEPLIEDLELGKDNTVNCDIKGFKELVPINILGRGIIKILSIVATIICNEDGVVLIDEIDNGLHFRSQEILWSTIFKIADELNVQIIATTHSYDCLRMYSKQYNKFSPDKDNLRLFRIEKTDEYHEIIAYNHERLTSSTDFEMEVR